ncbi:MAG: nickel pincer cofactor biosynthesis protein LarB [Planctomycetes bacterium]|nr:nickel pincer cofactor biosynthesis protein LarB [Planctomycetota bacterium]
MDWEDLAKALITGRIDLARFVAWAERTGSGSPPTAESVNLDLDRARRCGFPEVVFGEGKSAEMIGLAVERLRAERQAALVTRLDPAKAEPLLARFPDARYNPVAHTLRLDAPSSARVARTSRVAIVTAGSSDLPVAEEARETVDWMGVDAVMVQDVGVAGPHRLRERLDELRGAGAIVVVAGMEGALPSVVGGYVDCPVVAVPTSVGYGAALGGFAALLGMLNSCAANVAVVNIDAGFKGGYLAAMIAQRNPIRSGVERS